LIDRLPFLADRLSEEAPALIPEGRASDRAGEPIRTELAAFAFSPATAFERMGERGSPEGLPPLQ